MFNILLRNNEVLSDTI